MTNEEAKAYLKRRIKDNNEMIEARIEFLVEEARLFIDNVQEAKDDKRKKVDEVYDLLGTFKTHYEDIEAYNMQAGAYEVVLRLLED